MEGNPHPQPPNKKKKVVPPPNDHFILSQQQRKQISRGAKEMMFCRCRKEPCSITKGSHPSSLNPYLPLKKKPKENHFSRRNHHNHFPDKSLLLRKIVAIPNVLPFFCYTIEELPLLEFGKY